jgi:hypothetical protein
MSPVTKSARSAASKKTSARALRTAPAPRKVNSAKAAVPAAIVNTAPPVSDREAQLRQSMAADFKREFLAAGFPMTDDFALELATEAASAIAAATTTVNIEVELLRQALDQVRLATAVLQHERITALSRLREERRVIRRALALAAGNEALLMVLAARSREIDEQILSRPAQTGHELAARITLVIDALNDGDDACSVLPILASCRTDAGRCTPSAG